MMQIYEISSNKLAASNDPSLAKYAKYNFPRPILVRVFLSYIDM